MQQIPLTAIANQSLSIDLDAGQFELRIKEAAGCMMVDVTLDGVTVITGARCLAGEPLIPYAYLQSGNFVFSTANDELPFWDQFETTQALFYLTNAEMA